jgi:hypothetical protein
MWQREFMLDGTEALLPNPYGEEEEDVIERRLAPFDSVNSDRSVSEQAVQSGEEDTSLNQI